MRVSIIKEKKIQNMIIDEKSEGSYWVTDTDSNGIERNLISIEVNDMGLNLISNKKVYCVENELFMPKTELQFNKFYLIKNDMEDNTFFLYCTETLTDYNYYEVSNNLEKGIIIGNNQGALINYNLLSPNSCFIKRINNRVFIVDNNKIDPIYVNDSRVKKYKELKNGDVIFISGLKIMYVFIKDSYNNILYYLGINNLNNSIHVNLMPTALSQQINPEFEDVEDEMEYPLYDEKEYFHKIPRFVKTIKTFELQIDDPPGKQDEKGTPFILTMGPMITMLLTSLMTFYNTMSGISGGQTTWARAVPAFVMCGSMLLSSLLMPIISRKYEKTQKKKKEKLRQKKYGEYIEEKRQEIIKEKQAQTKILLDSYPPIEKTVETIVKKNLLMWQRRLEDPDYLHVNLGKASYPMDIQIHYPEKHFSLDEDNLKDMVESLGNEPKLLENVPYIFSFLDNYISGLIGEETVIGEYMRRILLQILAFHSYDDLKIVILTDSENEYQWSYLKSVPHIFSDDKKIRFFATNNDEHKEVTYYLDKILNYNAEVFKSNDVAIDELNQTYLVITDCFKKIRDLDFIKNLLDSKKYLGFSLFILDHQMTHLPDQCSSFIEIKDGVGGYYNKEDFEGVINFDPNLENEINYDDCIFTLANVPIEIENTEEGHIPEKLGFLEMYNVGKIEQLNIMNRWKLNDPTKSLRAPLGLNKQEGIIYLDLHEKYHGPHGLIAGTTGSGKSEFIITYVLSMVVNYSPNEVAFILIDYKGGGLAGAFENKKNNFRLPHLAGTITNLDKNEMNRTLVSIQSELTRRQAKFNEVRDELGESTIDIYKYQKFFREGKIKEPMPHLFIICDEFAELKSQQPEFMDNLISAARIGRSLGVHLILATQKPSGVVNDQIWSNTKFRVCLKVAGPGDSNEVIKCPDAASIKNVGRFYLQVGMNEIFVLGQSGYCGGNYVPSEIVKKVYDRSVSFIDNIGNVTKIMDNKQEVKQTVEDLGDELSNVLKYVTNIAMKQNVRTRNLWLDAIPEKIMLNDIIAKYNFSSENVTAIIGEYDDPSGQNQGILALPINQEANTIVYGLTGNNREMFLRTFIFSLCENYSSDDINIYIFDFGSETFRIFSKLPHVGDVVFSSESDKIDKMFKLIDNKVLERKKEFTDYNGDYDNYCKNSGKKVPRIVIIINNLESFKESYSAYDDLLQVLSREGSRYGVTFLITTGTRTGLYGKFLKNYPNEFVLDMNSKEEYVDILGKIGNVYPAEFPGRGLFKKDIAYEYQVARICEDDEIVEFIKEQANILSKSNPNKAKAIPVLPDVVSFEMLYDELTDLKQVPIGIEKESLNTSIYNFKKNKATIISANELSDLNDFILTLLKSYRKLENVISVLFDFEEIFSNLKPHTNSYCSKDYDNFVAQIIEYFNTKIKNTDYNMMLFLTGLEKYKDSVSQEKKEALKNLVKQNDNCFCLFIDSNFGMKKVIFEAWYTDLIVNANGIWVGPGFAEQGVIKNNGFGQKYSQKISNEFAWVVKNGEAVMIKLININSESNENL